MKERLQRFQVIRSRSTELYAKLPLLNVHYPRSERDIFVLRSDGQQYFTPGTGQITGIGNASSFKREITDDTCGTDLTLLEETGKRAVPAGRFTPIVHISSFAYW